MKIDSRKLLSRVNSHMLKALDAAAGMCLTRTHYEVTPEHILLKLVDPPAGDLRAILDYYAVDVGWLLDALTAHLEGLRTGNTGKPSVSSDIVEILQTAWMIGSVERGHLDIRTGTFLLGFLIYTDSEFGELYEGLREKIPVSDLRRDFDSITADSSENPTEARPLGEPGVPSAQAEEALRLYTIDVTDRARKGELDPVFGREEEIRRMIDILMRRKKNNPILVGEPGVGKTALVEGLAVKIVDGRVPDFLAKTRIISVDMGLLQAGAGVKGEFENRLKAVIEGIKGSADPIISFIDEAHTLIGAGGQAGGSDAANLLKPALARGELRTIAATTWAEYKKYFEKDAALSRRFELVKVEEPSENLACVMLRGLREKYETTHRVNILDSAVVAAVRLSSRYLTGRHLPDKAEGLLDTAAARVKVGHSCEPARLQDIRERINNLNIELNARRRDAVQGGTDEDPEIHALTSQLEQLDQECEKIAHKWESEKQAIMEVERLRSAVGDAEKATPELSDALKKLEGVQATESLIPLEVDEDVVASVVADWTGIPLGRMVRDEAESVLHFEDRLRERIRGQDHAIAAVGKSIRMSKAGVSRPEAPIGVFLFVGPSGVGKTECARVIAELLFGGEKSIVGMNMSEYMEQHTVSRLIGSPPGYVGYGEGGRLTEAVRQRPYSVVILDEVEKAHPDVLNIFYQIFDRGVCNDGEGREINFRNTIIIMTSNLGLDQIQELCNQPELPDVEKVVEEIHPILRNHFKPALLARFQVVPFYPLGQDMLREIAQMKLAQISERLAGTMRTECSYDPEIPDLLAERCQVSETGARALDRLLEDTIMPAISTEILSRMGEEGIPKTVAITTTPDGEFTFRFET
jgi:type VI secretion system protein VasG